MAFLSGNLLPFWKWWMSILLSIALLSIALPASAVDWQTPIFVGDCHAKDSRTDAVRWAAYLMGIPQSQVRETIIYCDPWTPFGGRTFREVGEEAMDCHDRRFWTWLIGCMSGLSSGYRPGPVLLLHIHPSVADTLIAAAQQQGMSSGSRTWDQIRCFWTFKHFVRLVIHEYNHTLGYRHGPAMTAEDQRVYDYFMAIARLKGFAVRHEWEDCKTTQPRRYRDEAVRERVNP